MKLDPSLLHSTEILRGQPGSFEATLEAHGVYSSFQYVLRLSPIVHKKLAGLRPGISSNRVMGFDGAQAFSTYLHETIHWWQHIGSTYGLMLSLTYPTQAHANYSNLKSLLAKAGFKKSIRELVDKLPGPGGFGTLRGLANTIVNNHFDFGAFRYLTFDRDSAQAIVNHPLFENVGHTHHMTYANNVLVLANTVDQQFQVFQHPKEWEEPFRKLRETKERGFYFRSPVELWPVGAREIMEGQACICQLQYLTFASGGRLGWDDYRDLGMLHGVYEVAFKRFLGDAGLDWPPTVDHPTVALFLLICDMSINPGAGFPHALNLHFPTFITDTDPGARFTMLSALVRLKCPHAATRIRTYSHGEYAQVSTDLAQALLIDSPLKIAQTCDGWARTGGPFESLMEEYRTFDYGPVNFPIRVLFSHFLAFMRDKLARPEFFCWPGAWMAGERVSEDACILFDRHAALFVDKEDDDGVFPRLHPDRDEALVQNMFDTFYATNLTYDLTDQWISKPEPFTYDYHWLSQTAPRATIKDFADRHFLQAFGVHPDTVEVL